MAKLQDALKNEPTKLGYMIRKDTMNKFSEGQNVGSEFKNFNPSVNNNNGLASKVNSSSIIPMRPLNLTLK